MLRARTVLGLALLLPALGSADPAKDRIKRFSSLASSKVVTERIEAIRELRTADDPRIVEALFKEAFQDEDFRVAEAAVRFLARTATPEALDWMKSNGPAHNDPRVRYYTLRTLESLPEPPSAALLEPYARDASHWVIRLEAAAALARTPDEAAVPLLRALLSDPMDPVRGLAILGLSDHKAVQHLPDIRKALLDPKDWRVRSSALEAIEALKDYGAIPQMQEALKRETELRMIDDLEQALDRMGAARKADLEEKLRAEAGPADPGPGGTVEVETRRHAEEIDYGPSLKELKTLSRRIAYLFDCSQSMADVVHEHPEPPAGSRPKEPKPKEYEVGGENDPKKRKGLSDETAMGYERAKQIEKEKNEFFPPTKLGFVQREICRAVRQLKPETSFNIIGFRGAGKQMPWKAAYTQATPEAIAKAVTFTKMQTPDGETAAYDALVLALGFQEHDLFRQSASWDPKSWPDTLLLFSDGRPTDGLIIQEEEFVNSVRRLFRICRTRIHTIGVGRGDLHLLEDIAKTTGGRFIQIADIE